MFSKHTVLNRIESKVSFNECIDVRIYAMFSDMKALRMSDKEFYFLDVVSYNFPRVQKFQIMIKYDPFVCQRGYEEPKSSRVIVVGRNDTRENGPDSHPITLI